MILNIGCKINLGLEVGARRNDGYHDLRSIFFPLSIPCDILEVEPRPEPGLELTCDREDLQNSDNLVARAYEGFTKATGLSPGISARLRKGIPTGAGLGGGSADAAIFLKWLNSCCGGPLSQAGLWNLAARTGADAPFFLLNQPALVRGKGEIIQPVSLSLEGLFLVLVWPQISVSTPWAFGALDRWRERTGGKDLTYLAGKDKNFVPSSLGGSNNFPAPDLRNDLEQPVFEAFPSLGVLKRELLDLGAVNAAMSGSGSSVYGLFVSERTALDAVENLHAVYRHVFFMPLENTGM